MRPNLPVEPLLRLRRQCDAFGFHYVSLDARQHSLEHELAIEELLHEAGVPPDLFRALLLPSSDVKALIEMMARGDSPLPKASVPLPGPFSRPRTRRCAGVGCHGRRPCT